VIPRIRLGRTGLEVGVAGLGCGGHSRLGQSYGHNTAESVAVVEAALDLGIDFIDTAAAYRTEEIVGAALRGRRDQAVVSTKTLIRRRARIGSGTALISARDLDKRLNDSLERLGTDYIDVYNLHGVQADELDHVNAELVPALLRQQQAGKIRFLGITELFVSDTRHAMLDRALGDGVWDVVMVGFNLLNQSARTGVFVNTLAQDVGVQLMFAVRRALSDRSALDEALAAAVAAGQIDSDRLVTLDLDALVHASGAHSLVDLAYRFCRHEPGVHEVLTGTGSIDHLRANVQSISDPPLPESTLAELVELFGQVDCLSGN
jgi:aryl-alcohol dehydrogenase-like predicted oxidoreductase